MLQGILPAPKHSYTRTHAEEGSAFNDESQQKQLPSRSKNIPPYPNRKGFLPLNLEDFEDGGAYPEIHVVQYPLNMGRPNANKGSSALVPVQVDDSGRLRADMIVKQGMNRNKMVQSQLSDVKESSGDKDKMALPDEDEIAATAAKTQLALEALLNSKIKNSAASSVVNPGEAPEPTYIRYIPNPNAPGFNPAAKQRVIKMVEAQVDPMEPPKHKITKAPRGPPSPPVPVLHSPPRKLTVEDSQAWKIPPCISNWKNARGFIIPLDKRLAADGRGLQEVTINNKFATLSEALFITERKATEDLKIRNDLRKKMALKEKEEREMSLREMANRARMERAGVRPLDPVASATGAGMGSSSSSAAIGGVDEDEIVRERRRERFMRDRAGSSDEEDNDRGAAATGGGTAAAGYSDDDEEADEFAGETEDEKIARQQRERLRMERRKEREREMRIENMKGNMRQKKADRDEGRDISEKIALGMLKGTGAKITGESLYDSRLFNQSAGMDAGFGAEDEYNAYSKPLFDRGEATSIYRPKQGAEDIYGDADAQLKKLSDTSRFKADKGFKGAEGRSDAGPRDAPVQFEKASDRPRSDDDDGPTRRRHSSGRGDGSGSDDDRRSRRSSGGSSSNRRGDDTTDPFGIGDIVRDNRRRGDSDDEPPRRRRHDSGDGSGDDYDRKRSRKH